MGDDAYASGYLAELDKLLESDAGQALRSSLPSTIWDYGKIGEHTYYIYSPDASAAEYRGENQSWALIWDTELAEKYDLDLSTWQDGWKNHLNELRTVCAGEAGNPNFAPFDDLPLFYDGSNGSLIYWYFQQGTGAYIPFVFSGSIDLVTSVSQSDWLPFFEEWSGLDLLADQTLPVWAESLAELAPLDEIRFFDDCQAYDAAWGEYDDLTEQEDTQVFLTRYSGSLAGFSSRFDDEFWKTHDYVVCDAVIDRNALGVRTGISSASEKQEAAMEFLAALYTDPELSNALAWGDAPVTNGLVTSGTKVFTLGGNLLVTYQRNNEDIIYQDLWQAASDTLEASLPSPLIGFSYSKEKFDLDNPTQILNLLNEYLADYMEEAQ
jgi:hypothetical protein